MSAKAGKLVTLGRVSGGHGIKGWLKIQSFTEPRENLLDYSPWILRRADREQGMVVEQGQAHGNSLVAKIRGVDDRNSALEWRGAQIAVERWRLPPCAPGEYYWTDLEGLEVRTPEGTVLGTVDHLIATGSNDVLVVEGERQYLIPFLPDEVIRAVDLEGRVIVADWCADD